MPKASSIKDMRYLESLADAAGISNSLGNAVKNAFAMALATGGAEAYVPMLPEYVARLSGVDLIPAPKPKDSP